MAGAAAGGLAGWGFREEGKRRRGQGFPAMAEQRESWDNGTGSRVRNTPALGASDAACFGVPRRAGAVHRVGVWRRAYVWRGSFVWFARPSSPVRFGFNLWVPLPLIRLAFDFIRVHFFFCDYLTRIH